MRFLFIDCRLDKYKIEIFFINFIILLYIFRTVIPIFKYPFIILYFTFLLLTLLIQKDRIFNRVVFFLQNYTLLILLFVILCYSSFFTHKIYLSVFKDVTNAILLLSLFYLLTFMIKSKKELKFFINNLLRLLVFFAVLISLLNLSELFDIYSVSSDRSFKIDYNFASIPVFFGFIGVLYLLSSANSFSQKFFYNFLLIIFFVNILFSGSRRGVIVMIIIILILLIAQLFTLLRKNNYIKKIGLNSRVFLILLAVITFTFYIFTDHTSYKFKNRFLELIGSKNIFLVKRQVTIKLGRGISIFNRSFDYSDLFIKIWTKDFDPIYPESGWGFKNCKRVFPLTGENVEIVPVEAIGCLIDSTCYRVSNPLNSEHASYSLINKIKVKKNDKYKLRVYCFVSNEFDGSSVRFGIASTAIIKKVVSDNSIIYYDLQNKGVWQELEFEIECNDGVVPIYISIVKNRTKDFSKMNGYVIFAYPQYNKVEPDDSNLSFIDSYDKDILDEVRLTNMKKYASDKLIDSSSKEDKFYNLNKNDNDLLSFSERELVKHDIPKAYMQAGFFSVPFSYLANLALIVNDKDPIRNWAAKFISEDTTYFDYKNDLFIDTVTSKFSGPRINRWRFAWQIYSKEYNLKQKIIGSGFNYLNWYGFYFYRDKTKSDWPHNPFLSVLLYSGILGLIFYIIVLSRAIMLYLKYRKEYLILFIFFLITFFFAFFSVNSPFTPPIWGFFLILPFFIHSVHRKSNSEIEE